MNLLRASSFYRDENCFANREIARQAEQAGKVPQKETKWTERGTRVHEGDTQTPDEESARAHVIKKSYEIFDSYAQGIPFKVEYNKRFYLRYDGLVPYFTGEPDRFVVLPSQVIFVDFKPGFEQDWEYWIAQMDAYSALLSEAFDPPTLRGIIITRFYGTREYVYTRDKCKEIIERIKEVAATHNNPALFSDLPPTPGSWCRYCAGRLICENAMTFPVREQLIGTLPGGKVGADILQGLMRVRNLAEDKIQWYENQLASKPSFLDGLWVLGPGRVTGKFTSATLAEKALIDAWVLTKDEVSECATLSAAKVRDKIAVKKNVPKDAAKNIMDTHLGELITYSTSKGSLVKLYDKLEDA